MARLFTPQYPVLFVQPGPRCTKTQHRGNRISLQCVRRVHGPEQRHLMDIMDRDARCTSKWSVDGFGSYACSLQFRHEGKHEDRTTEAPATYAWD